MAIDDSMIKRFLVQCELNDAVPSAYKEELKRFAHACYDAGRNDAENKHAEANLSNCHQTSDF